MVSECVIKIQMSKRKETEEVKETKKKILRPDSVAFFLQSVHEAPIRLRLLEDKIIPMLREQFGRIRKNQQDHELKWGLHDMVHAENATPYIPTEHRAKGINILEIPTLDNAVTVMVDIFNNEFVVFNDEEVIEDGEIDRLTDLDYAGDHLYAEICQILEAEELEDSDIEKPDDDQ